jgi:hypothetical protein
MHALRAIPPILGGAAVVTVFEVAYCSTTSSKRALRAARAVKVLVDALRAGPAGPWLRTASLAVKGASHRLTATACGRP